MLMMCLNEKKKKKKAKEKRFQQLINILDFLQVFQGQTKIHHDVNDPEPCYDLSQVSLLQVECRTLFKCDFKPWLKSNPPNSHPLHPWTRDANGSGSVKNLQVSISVPFIVADSGSDSEPTTWFRFRFWYRHWNQHGEEDE